MKDFDCLVIHEGSKDSKIPAFESRCMFRYMDIYVDSVYIQDIDMIMDVLDIVPCGSRKPGSNLPDFMIFVSDRFPENEELLEEAESDYDFEIAAEEV